jgi:hypothetical protein
MRADSTVKVLLLIIAILLGVIALRPLFAPPAAQTQGGDVYPFFIEPGYTTPRARPTAAAKSQAKWSSTCATATSAAFLP